MTSGSPSRSPIPRTSHAPALETPSFIQLAENQMFVDKSYALVEFLQSGIHPSHLILRGRRSGKTTLLSMFKAFFQRTNPADQARRKKLFVDNQLAIVQSPMFESEFGRYPVLHIDLSNVIGLTMDELVKRFGVLVHRIARDMQNAGYFIGSDELGKADQTFLDDVLQRRLAEELLPTALYDLTQIVETLTKRRLIVLIDEYDTPVSNATQNGFFSEADNFFRVAFSSLLKGNEHTRGAFAMGIFQVAKAGRLSGINNMRVFPVDIDMYSKACMFTEDETRKLYDREAVLRGDGNALSFSFADLKTYYNGYYAPDGTRLYNPWSVGNALTEGSLHSYWVEDESDYDRIIKDRIGHFLMNDSQVLEQVHDLINEEDIRIGIEEDMSYHSIADMSSRQFWTLTYYAGYLTKLPPVSTAHASGNADDVHAVSSTPNTYSFTPNRLEPTYISVCIPNSEIYQSFFQWLADYFVQLAKSLKRNKRFS